MSLDITHEILTHVATRRDLLHLISCSRQYYDIFQLHPNSILRSVVCNEFGIPEAALSYAWDTHRHFCMDQSSHTQDDYLSTKMKPKCVEALRENHSVVSRMAKAFSVRRKDSLYIKDTMTGEESRRFHIAVYVYWQYQLLWDDLQNSKIRYHEDEDSMDSDEEEDTGDEDEDLDMKTRNSNEQASLDEATTVKCYEFLHRQPIQVLYWVNDLLPFLIEDVTLCLAPLEFVINSSQQKLNERPNSNYVLTSNQWLHWGLSAGPSAFGKWIDYFPSSGVYPPRLASKHVWLAELLANVLRQKARQEERQKDKILLSTGPLVGNCQKCGALRGLRDPLFYNITNIKDLSNDLNYRFLPGMLPCNPVELQRIAKRLYGSPSLDQPYNTRIPEEVIVEIGNHAEAQAASALANTTNAQPGSDNQDEEDTGESPTTSKKEYKWSPMDPLCQTCFRQLFMHFYYAWWVDERETDRVESFERKEDCWWGFECRTQRRKDHALKLNHCCPRTREARV